MEDILKMNFNKHCEQFLKLIDGNKIRIFLRRDKYFAVADNFHLSNILLYFVRANFQEDDYTVRNFFIALYLSHDIYEDNQKARKFLLKMYFNTKSISNVCVKSFCEDKFKFFERMGFNGYADKKVCHNIFKLVKSTIWKRKRRPVINRKKPQNPHCNVCKIHSY